jgi:DNA-damage-inducible protein J
VHPARSARKSKQDQAFMSANPFFSPKKLDRALQMPHILTVKTAAVHSRIEPEIKESAEGILRKLGLSPTDAIRLFYTQITLRNGLPFPVAIPNEETAQAMEDSRKNRDLSTYSSTDELFKSWDE